ncbi:MAG: hypothetical protein V3U63_00625 [Gemmatimonadota bacterium]
MIQVDEPAADMTVTCPRCERECRFKTHAETGDESWLQLGRDE